MTKRTSNGTPAQRGRLANFGNKMARPAGTKGAKRVPPGGSLVKKGKKK